MAPNTGVSNSESLSVGRWLFDFYTPSSGPISGDRIIISNGASNGLATILQKFTDPRSTRGIWMIELRWPKDPEQSVGDMAPPPPRLVDVDREMHGDSHFGNTVSNGSFSKIVAPGLRVDWLEATPAFIQDMGTVQVSCDSILGNPLGLIIQQWCNCLRRLPESFRVTRRASATLDRRA